MKILVIGGAGLVGNALARVWGRQGAEVAATAWQSRHGKDFLDLDIRDARAVAGLIRRLRPGVVALPAANPYVDYCETHPEETRAVNVAGSLNVARACRDIDVPMIFYSSDYVFDGSRRTYDENDTPCPINEYGRQKVEAEAGILSLNRRNIVIRTSGAYGWQWRPKNFVLQTLGKLRAAEKFPVAMDLKSNPTYVENLAEITAALAAAGAGGLFHVAGSDSIRRYDFALEIARVFSLDGKLVTPTLSRDVALPAKRPLDSSLVSRRLAEFSAPAIWGTRRGLEHMRDSEQAWSRYASSNAVVETFGLI